MGTLSVSAASLSKAMTDGVNLNVLSHAMITAIVDQVAQCFEIAQVRCDTVGTPETLRSKIMACFDRRVDIVVCPKADSLYPIVSCASIEAKVTRDAFMTELASLCSAQAAPSPGSGYSSDPVAIRWIEWVLTQRDKT